MIDCKPPLSLIELQVCEICPKERKLNSNDLTSPLKPPNSTTVLAQGTVTLASREKRFHGIYERHYNRIVETYGATAMDARLSSDVPPLVPLSEIRFNVPQDLQPRLKLLRLLLDGSATKRILFIDTEFYFMPMPYCFVSTRSAFGH
jgi:hypothetical protein